MNDPIARVRRVYERARKKDPGDYTRVALATADADGNPSVRMVLLRGFDERGFVFYTNYGSRKAAEIEANPHAALCFYWEAIKEQVRVAGGVTRVSAEESDAYFASRARGSRLAAIASQQSRPLASRSELVARYLKLKAQYAGHPIPRPEYWGGYRILPARIEFWNSRAHRMHDRVVYEREGDGWRMERLYP
jgi:pyridoxamine 5'-phosphate oxidase